MNIPKIFKIEISHIAEYIEDIINLNIVQKIAGNEYKPDWNKTMSEDTYFMLKMANVPNGETY